MTGLMVVIGNGSHTTVVSEDQVIAAKLGDKAFEISNRDEFNAAALAIAVARFAASNLDTGNVQVIKVVDTEFEDGDPDEVSDIGLTEGAYIEITHQVLDDDELSISSDALVSGFNVQSWSWLSPTAALDHLTGCPPVLSRRQSKNRSVELEEELATLKAHARVLVGALRSDPSQNLEEQLVNLEQILGIREPEESVVFRTTIRTWEAGEGSADGYSADQLKPWSVTVSNHADQLRVCVWPRGESVDEAVSGLGVLIEVNQGLPALHISPGPNADNSCHVHAISEHEVEVAPGTRLSRAQVPSRVYEGSGAYVLSNGSPH